MIDLHIHIVFGVDDGASTIEESSAMLRIAAGYGVKRMVAASHFSAQRHALYRQNLPLVQAEAQKWGIELLPGAEYFLASAAEVDELQDLGSSKSVLLDFGCNYISPGAKNLLFDLRRRGYSICIAHPERLFSSDYRCVEQLAGLGLPLQLNAGSFIGKYGSAARNAAFRIAGDGLCSVIASDAHSPRDFNQFELCRELLLRRFGQEPFDAWTHENPERILRGETPYLVRPGKIRSWWRRFL